MITYLLLRNNKETGPFTLIELKQFGLKPYDLIWANGKSAAWRYPGEIEELKEFAPMVEEQPYDRFFKKPSETKEEEQRYQPPAREPEPIKEPAPVAEIQPAFTPKKSVYVTMPGQKVAVTKPAVQEQPPTRRPEPPSPVREQEPQLVAETISITENPVAAEIKYSQPLDEIKQMYVKTLQDRKQRIANRTFLLQAAKKAAVILAIVGAGVLIGLTLNSRSGDKQVLAENKPSKPAQTPVVPPATEEEKQPQQEQVQLSELNNQSLSSEKNLSEPLFREPDQPTIRKNVQEKVTLPYTRKEAVTEKKDFDPQQDFPGVETDSRTGERNRKMRNPADAYDEVDAEIVRQAEPRAMMKGNDLSRFVSIKSNEYQRVAFGGIRNLQLTVYNDSKYALDNVTVELQYLKPSEQPLRTENIHFRSVAPGGSLTIRIPDTNRGIKVLYKITNILSTQSAKETAGLE